MRFSQIVLGLCACIPLFAQVAAVSVPFVGCESSGQTEVSPAPEGKPMMPAISAKDAKGLAYYKSADGIGVLGPRGWYCEGAWGSGGGVLFLSPKPIVNDSSGWKGLDGAVIAVTHTTSENSGRYDVAEIIGRVFPQYRAYAAEVMKSMGFPLPASPFPKDTLVRRGLTLVEYSTVSFRQGCMNCAPHSC